MVSRFISDSLTVTFSKRGQIQTCPSEVIYRELQVDGLIRFCAHEFMMLPGSGVLLTHFNLGVTSNRVGARYACVPILVPGHRDQRGHEAPPVLDLGRVKQATCQTVIQQVALHRVPEFYFASSLPHISDEKQLRVAMIRRYARLHPDMSDADIIAAGCAVTQLRFH